MRRTPRVAAVALVCLALATGCGPAASSAPATIAVPGCPVAVLPSSAVGAAPSPAASPASTSTCTATESTPGTAPATPGTLTVLAAASLSGAFTTIAHAFEADHPGVAVRLSFDGSAALVTQIQQGAPADLVATADQPTMNLLVDAGLVTGKPTVVATNALVIAVPADNPAHVGELADLARVRTVVCAPAVPCGAAAQRVSAAAGVTLTPVSLEPSVAAVAAKVARGEADAGLVYRTDVLAAGRALSAVALPDTPAIAAAARTSYPIAVVAGTPRPALAAAFIAAVDGPDGRAILQAAGFGAPGAAS